MSHPQFTPAAERPLLRLRDCTWFFVPLVLMVELNMMSKSVIHAFLARTDNPSAALAAFNAAFTFYFAITAASEVTTVLCLSFLKSRADSLRLSRFIALILSLPIAIALGVAFTPLGDMVFGSWFGLGGQARAEARGAVGLLIISAPFLLCRANAFALLMLARRTIIITFSTLVRLLSLTVSLAILPMWLSGAAIGAAALVICMASEALFAWAFAWPHLRALPASRPVHETIGQYWSFAWPLIINASAELGSIFTINLFLGRLATAELAIAAFGVVHGLVSLLMAPVRNLAQSAQTLVARREDVRTMVVFSAQLVGIFVLLALVLFQTPLRDTILRGLIGLTPELAAYAQPAMAISFLMAAFWGLHGAVPRAARHGAHDGIAGGQRRAARRHGGGRLRDRVRQPGAERRDAGHRGVDAVVCRRGGGEYVAAAEIGVVCGAVMWSTAAFELQRDSDAVIDFDAAQPCYGAQILRCPLLPLEISLW